VAPAASATFAHCAATSAAADATDVSLAAAGAEPRAGDAEFSAAMAASTAATPATDTAAWTSALCSRASSLRFCFRSLTHFFSEMPLHGAAILRGSCTRPSTQTQVSNVKSPASRHQHGSVSRRLIFLDPRVNWKFKSINDIKENKFGICHLASSIARYV
jgi:hypothetical protein